MSRPSSETRPAGEREGTGGPSGLDRYRLLLAAPGTRTTFAVGFLVKLPVIAIPLVLSLQVSLGLGRSLGAAGLVTGVWMAGVMAGAPVLGWAMDRLSMRPVLAVCAVTQAVFWVAADRLSYPALVCGALASGLLLVPGSTLTRMVLAARTAPEHRQPAFALDTVTSQLSYLAGPALGAVLSTQASPATASRLLGGALVLGLTAFALRSGPPARPAPDTEPGTTHHRAPADGPDETHRATPTTGPSHAHQPTPTTSPNQSHQPTPTTSPNQSHQPTPTTSPNQSHQPTPTTSPNQSHQPTPTHQPAPVGGPGDTRQPAPADGSGDTRRQAPADGPGEGRGPAAGLRPETALFPVLACAFATGVVSSGFELSLLGLARAQGALAWVGLLIAACGAFAVLGGLLFGTLSIAPRPAVPLLLLGLVTAPLGLAGDWRVLLAAVAPAAMLSATSFAVTATACGALATERTRGRVLGLYGAAVAGGNAAGAPLAGTAIAGAGPAAGFLSVGAAAVLVALAALLLHARAGGARLLLAQKG